MKYFPFLFLILLLGLGDVSCSHSSSSKGNSTYFLLPLNHRVPNSGRRLLTRNGYLPVDGSIRNPGYFFTDIQLGTPPRTFSVIIDTGSTITYVPCIKCAQCGQHNDAAFDPSNSSTSQSIGCRDRLCQCGSPACSCSSDNQCYYKRSYAEQSSSEGWMIRDQFGFPDGLSSVPITFGCENKETGEIFRQKADGIMGLGRTTNSLPNQLAAAGVIDNVFSLCFGYPLMGLLLLGTVPLPEDLMRKQQFASLTKTALPYYNIFFEGIVIAGKKLEGATKEALNVGYGTVLDSGTTFTYLPDAVFSVFRAAVTASVDKSISVTTGPDESYNDLCWKIPGKWNISEVEKHFPTIEFAFEGATITLTAPRYLFLAEVGTFCLGVANNGNQGSLIGAISVRNALVQYDMRSRRVGFVDTDCRRLNHWLSVQKGGAIGSKPYLSSAPPPSPSVSPSPSASPSPAASPPPSVTPSTSTSPQNFPLSSFTAPESSPMDITPNIEKKKSSTPSVSIVMAAMVAAIVSVAALAGLLAFLRKKEAFYQTLSWMRRAKAGGVDDRGGSGIFQRKTGDLYRNTLTDDDVLYFGDGDEEKASNNGIRSDRSSSANDKKSIDNNYSNGNSDNQLNPFPNYKNSVESKWNFIRQLGSWTKILRSGYSHLEESSAVSSVVAALGPSSMDKTLASNSNKTASRNYLSKGKANEILSSQSHESELAPMVFAKSNEMEFALPTYSTRKEIRGTSRQQRQSLLTMDSHALAKDDSNEEEDMEEEEEEEEDGTQRLLLAKGS